MSKKLANGRHLIAVGPTAYGSLNHLRINLPGLEGIKTYDDAILWLIRNIDIEGKIAERTRAAESVLSLIDRNAPIFQSES